MGDAVRPYYDSGNNRDLGFEDYALIQDYNPVEDIIQLHGSSDRYRLDSSPVGLPSGTVIYYQTDTQDESISIIAGISNINITLNENNFIFI